MELPIAVIPRHAKHVKKNAYPSGRRIMKLEYITYIKNYKFESCLYKVYPKRISEIEHKNMPNTKINLVPSLSILLLKT
jgi:hypothetical protein